MAAFDARRIATLPFLLALAFFLNLPLSNIPITTLVQGNHHVCVSVIHDFECVIGRHAEK
jgi:hypothetical protein